MRKLVFVLMVLIAASVNATERGGDSPQAVAERFKSALASRNIEELAACMAERERGALVFLNFIAAVNASTLFEGLDKETIQSHDFSIDDLQLNTQRKREYADIVKRNGIKLGGPPQERYETDPIAHFISIAGPNPDRTVADLDAYNRRYLGDSNPSDMMLSAFPDPVFSDFTVLGAQTTAKMGQARVNFEKVNGRWFLSDFVSLGIK